MMEALFFGTKTRLSNGLLRFLGAFVDEKLGWPS